MRLDAFLLGVIATSCIVAGMFFLRFWRDTRDQLFLAFGASFLIEGVNRCGYLFAAAPCAIKLIRAPLAGSSSTSGHVAAVRRRHTAVVVGPAVHTDQCAVGGSLCGGTFHRRPTPAHRPTTCCSPPSAPERR